MDFYPIPAISHQIAGKYLIAKEKNFGTQPQQSHFIINLPLKCSFCYLP